MRRLLLLRWLVVFGVTAFLLHQFCVGALTFEAQEITQISNSDDQKASTVFRFKNSGTNAVIIKSVQPGCGCTTAELTKEIYNPGETGEIKVVFNFEGRVGRQDKVIQVTTDDETNKLIVLTFRVEITEPLNCSSRLLLWRVGEEPADKEAIITPTQPRKITSLTAQPAAPADVAARVEPRGGEGKYRLVVHPASPTKVINVAIACVATFADGSTHPFTVFALVR